MKERGEASKNGEGKRNIEGDLNSGGQGVEHCEGR